MTIPNSPYPWTPLVDREFVYLIEREEKKGDRADKKLLKLLEEKLEELRILYKDRWEAKEH